MSFTHLHLHSEHSLLDGNTKVKDVPLIAKELGQEAVGLTDHGSLAAALKFWKAGLEHGVKTIQGVEAYITPDHEHKEKDTPTWHLVLLAQNEIGRQNLFALSEIGWTQGFYKKPRVDHNDLLRHSEGIIALTACMAGEIARAIEAGDSDEALEALLRYKEIYGDRLYVELQPGNTKELNSTLAGLAEYAGVKTTVTVDSHYDHCTSKANEELLLIVQQVPSFKKSDIDRAKLMYAEAKKEPSMINRLNKLWPNRNLRFDHHDLHIMSRDEVVDHMDRQGFDGNALADSTLEIAERCETVGFKTGVSYLPNPFPEFQPDDYLRTLVFKGLEERGLDSDPVYVDRANEELEILKSMGFSVYFLIVWDIINEARSRNIYVGPGRGSAAGSLVAYALRITSRDPIKRKLLFFRFIDPSRPDWPDIDMDFQHDRRDEMKDYVREKYGAVLSISTFSQWKAKGLIRAVARALAVPLDEVNKACKKFETLEEYETSDQLKDFRAAHPEFLPIAKKFEGQISGTGMHAAGVLIANRPMYEIGPIESRTDPEDKKQRVPVSGFDMDDSAEVGLIKFDFLGLKGLTVIHDCVDLIKERHGVDIDWEELETTDEKVLAELGKGNTVGVFQMESSAYRKLLIEMGVDTFDDLVASNALVRPGAYLTVAKDYIDVKRGRKDLEYPHESVEEYLRDTYGTYIYQEQVMQLAVHLGGFSWAESNKLRKIIGKKRDVAEFKPFYDKWIEGAGAKVGEKKADKMWKDFEKHAGYSFNLSHSDCYSYVGYVTAYLKYYYPLEFIYSLLKNEKKDTTKMTYLLEAKRMGIEILPPDVNYSQQEMSVDGDSLRFGLGDIKGVGYAACKELITKRPFVSWDDMIDRIVATKCNSSVFEALTAVDAMASIPDAPRNSDAQKNYQEYLNYPIELEGVASLGLDFINLEDFDEDEDYALVCGVVKAIKRTPTWVRIEIEDMTGNTTCFAQQDNDLSTGEVVIALIGDKSMLGYTRAQGFAERIADDELSNFEKFILDRGFEDVSRLYEFGLGGLDSDKALVVPMAVRKVITKKGDPMAFVHITDGEQIEKITIFPSTWKDVYKLVEEYKPILVRLSYLKDGGKTVNASGIADAADILRKKLIQIGEIT